MEAWMLCRLDTWLRPSICARNCVGSVGLSGSWLCICVLISCRKPAWLICILAGRLSDTVPEPVAEPLAGVPELLPGELLVLACEWGRIAMGITGVMGVLSRKGDRYSPSLRVASIRSLAVLMTSTS